MIIDDFSTNDFISSLGTRWRGVSDQVMGGVSVASISMDHIQGQSCLRLQGDVRLENNGGFIQASLDLSDPGGVFDASDYRGLRLTVRGNEQLYSVHLRTSDTVRSWQSYRAQFRATEAWEICDLPFSAFTPHRLTENLDTHRLRRIGLVAIGRAFTADLAVSRIEYYQ